MELHGRIACVGCMHADRACVGCLHADRACVGCMQVELHGRIAALRERQQQAQGTSAREAAATAEEERKQLALARRRLNAELDRRWEIWGDMGDHPLALPLFHWCKTPVCPPSVP